MIVQGYLLSIKHPEHYPENPVVFINSLASVEGIQSKAVKVMKSGLILIVGVSSLTHLGNYLIQGGLYFRQIE